MQQAISWMTFFFSFFYFFLSAPTLFPISPICYERTISSPGTLVHTLSLTVYIQPKKRRFGELAPLNVRVTCAHVSFNDHHAKALRRVVDNPSLSLLRSIPPQTVDLMKGIQQ